MPDGADRAPGQGAGGGGGGGWCRGHGRPDLGGRCGGLVHSLDELPAEVDAELLDRAEAHLIGEANLHPQPAQPAGEKVLEVIAPDTYDDQERKNLEAAIAAPPPPPG